MTLSKSPFISVIIATFNRTKYLEICLKSVLANSYDRYEVIIVDQSKDNRTKELIDSKFSHYEKIRYLHTETIGLSHARNLGWKEAKGEIIAFVDDDAVPVRGWLEAYANAFSEIDPTPAIVGGKIEAIWEIPKPKWYPKEREFLLALYDIGDEIKPFSEFELPIGANFAILRKIIKEFRGFDNRVGFNQSRKKSMIAGEDTLIGLRIKDAGHSIYYQPGAKVYHHISANKLSKIYFLRRHFWEGFTQIVLEDCRNTLNIHKLFKILIWHIKNIWKNCSYTLNCVFVKKKDGLSRIMLHLSLIMLSIGICVKTSQLILYKGFKTLH